MSGENYYATAPDGYLWETCSIDEKKYVVFVRFPEGWTAWRWTDTRAAAMQVVFAARRLGHEDIAILDARISAERRTA